MIASLQVAPLFMWMCMLIIRKWNREQKLYTCIDFLFHFILTEPANVTQWAFKWEAQSKYFMYSSSDYYKRLTVASNCLLLVFFCYCSWKLIYKCVQPYSHIDIKFSEISTGWYVSLYKCRLRVPTILKLFCLSIIQFMCSVSQKLLPIQ